MFQRKILARGVTNHLFNKNNVKQVFDSLKKSGVDGIELLVSSNATESDIQKTKMILKQNSIPILSVHQSLTTLFDISITEVTNLANITRLLSAKILVLHLSALGDKIFDAKHVHALHALEKQYKISIGIENNPKHPLSYLRRYTWKGE